MDRSNDIQKQSDTTVAGQLNRYVTPAISATLQEISLEALVGEFLARIRNGALNGESAILLGCQIHSALRIALDIHSNRMSRKRYADMFGMVYAWWNSARPTIESETIVDLGCGSINPYGVLFLFLMLGARRGIAIDLDEIQEVQQAVQAVADCAAMMLIDPKKIVGDYSISRAQVLQNIESFDLSRLGAGDHSGIDGDRLCFRRESVFNLSLSDGEADLVISNTFLEHVPRVEEAVRELARITRKGGFGAHLIDGADHRRYWDPNCHALKFLEESTSETLVHGSNRVRPREFIPLFERHGFELVEFIPFEKIDIGPELRNQFVEPFKSMPLDSLNEIGTRLLVRKL